MKKTNEIYEEAIKELDSLVMRFKDGSETSVSYAGINRWQPMDESVATRGVLFTSINASGDAVLEGINYLPRHSEIHKHFHEDETEEVIVISGCINYTVFKTCKEQVKTHSGTLTAGQRLIILPPDQHYVFTAECASYIHVKFYDRYNEEN